MDGLRGIAAVTVLMGHTSGVLAEGVDHPGAVGALLAVVSQGLTLFFALSGFLLYRPFAAAMIAGRPRPRVGRFFTNRALRIFPGYLVILLLVSLVIGVANNQVLTADQPIGAPDHNVGYMVDPWLLVTNALMLQSFFPNALHTGLGVSWTLSVELVFYLTLPLLALLVSRLRPARIWAFIPAGILLLIGIAGKLWLFAISNPSNAAESNYLEWGNSWIAVLARSFLTHADLFACGMVAAVLVTLFQHHESACTRLLIRWAGIVIGLGAVLALRDTDFFDTGYSVLAGAVVLFVGLRGANGPGVAARVLEWAPLQFLGVISYSLYLWHMPVIWFLFRQGLGFPATSVGYWLNVLLVVAISVGLSTITYNLIEKPALQLKRKAEIRPAASAAQPAAVRDLAATPER